MQEWDAAAAAARAEAAGLAAERQAVDAAVEGLRTMLMQSVAERTRLAGEAEAAEQRMAVIQRVHLCMQLQPSGSQRILASYTCIENCLAWLNINPCQLRTHHLCLQDADEKAAAVADVQAQAAGLAAKLSEAEAALERNTEVTTNGLCCWRRFPAQAAGGRAANCPAGAQVPAALSWMQDAGNAGSQSFAQANSALSMVEREGFEAQLAAAQQAAETARSSAAAVRAHSPHDYHGVAATVSQEDVCIQEDTRDCC